MPGNQEGSLPGSKKMMALRQAYSLSSIWMSRKGFTNSSKILVATRAISSSGQCIGMMKSFPGETREICHQIFSLALRTRSYPEVTPRHVARESPCPRAADFQCAASYSDSQLRSKPLISFFGPYLSRLHMSVHPHCTQSLLHVLLWFTLCYT